MHRGKKQACCMLGLVWEAVSDLMGLGLALVQA